MGRFLLYERPQRGRERGCSLDTELQEKCVVSSDKRRVKRSSFLSLVRPCKYVSVCLFGLFQVSGDEVLASFQVRLTQALYKSGPLMDVLLYIPGLFPRKEFRIL